MGMLNHICAFLTLTAGLSAYGQTEAPLPTGEPPFMPLASDDPVYEDTDAGDDPETPGCIIETIQADGCYIPSDFDFDVIEDSCIADVLYEQVKVGYCDENGFSTQTHDCRAYCSGGKCKTTTVDACNYPEGAGTNVGYCECPEPST